MAKRKSYYYVLVMTNGGPVFVTETGERNWCYWDCLAKPQAFGRCVAEDITRGLNINGHEAFMVWMPFEMEGQPYIYADGEFVWKWKEKEDDDDGE